MKVNRESIYGTTASPFNELAFEGRCTRKGNTLYLHVFQWPSGGLKLTGLKTAVSHAVSLEGQEPLPVTSGTDGPSSGSLRRWIPSRR